MLKRCLVRILVGAVLCLALFAFVLTPVPVDAQGNPDLPAPAFGQVHLYRLEVALLVFYGDLLLATPAFTGLIRGRLPIEISTRGAKFAAETDESAAKNEIAIKDLEGATKHLAQRLKEAQFEIASLKAFLKSDSTQPEVDSQG